MRTITDEDLRALSGISGLALSPHGESTGIQVEILPEAGGRRAHMVGWIEDNLGVFGYTVDFE